MIDVGVYLKHVLETIADIQDLMQMGRSAFLESSHEQAAMKYYLQTLGESVKHIPENLQASQPQIAWPAIRGMRNRIVHEYLRIDALTLWNIAERELPALKDAI